MFMKTIFSCDPGIDDAFALLIMSKFTDGPSVILASYGNAPAETTLRNARILAKSVICSSLTKAAVYGHDANWGRILCALGYSGVDFDLTIPMNPNIK